MSSVTLNSYNIPSVLVLVDSGSSNCFIDMTFVNEHVISTYSVPPIQLWLFDGTTNTTITQALDLSIHFKTGDITPMTFYVTSLDGSCSLVLGHNWLTHFNPLIDWVLGSISFHSFEQNISAPQSSPQQSPDLPSLADLIPYDQPLSFSQRKAPPITIISAPALGNLCECKLWGLTRINRWVQELNIKMGIQRHYICLLVDNFSGHKIGYKPCNI